MVREGRVFIAAQGSGKPQFGSNYYVTAYEVGAQVAVGSSGDTADVRAGHGFAAGDAGMVGTDPTTLFRVDSVTSTQIVFSSGQTLALAEGDLLVNLGADTGSTEPNYDGSGAVVYTDMDYSNVATASMVQTTDTGRYIYWHTGISRWELVRSSTGAPVAIYTDTDAPTDEDRVLYGVRYAHLFATGGTGTEDDPWTVDGSNAVQAAIDDLPVATGGTVYMVAGYYDLGSGDPAVSIPILFSSDDNKAYSLIGDGRDITFLQYSGTGTAIRYAQVNAGGVLGSSYQSNELVFRGFAVQQVGTPRTGNAFYMTYISESLFEDLSVGCVRQDRSTGDEDTGFAYGIRLDGTAGDNVVDFNRFHRVYSLGNTIGIYIQNQGDNTVVSECSFEPRQDANVAQDGIRIINSQGITVEKNHFNYFHYDSNSYGLRMDTVIQGADISGNYFEGCSNGVYLYTDGNQKGIHIHGNFFTGTSTTTSVGVRAGIDGHTYTIKGLAIGPNSFASLGAAEIGIRLGADVKDFKLIGNTYDVTGGGTEVTFQTVDDTAVAGTGCRGIQLDPSASSSSFPRIRLIDSGQDQGHLILLNNSSAAGFSPRLYFGPGASGNVFSLSADSSGTLSGKDNSGSTVYQVSQAGAVVASSNITSGGHLRGLKATEALTTSAAIATAGRLLIDITNTSGTNTPTLVAPSSVDGQILILRCVALTAGTITLADGGNCDLSAAWVPNAGDTLTLIASGAIFYEIARSAN